MVALVRDEFKNHIKEPFPSEQAELLNAFSNDVMSDTSQVHITDTDGIGHAASHKFANDGVLSTFTHSL